jgi:flavin-dependent dehydrogenase
MIADVAIIGGGPAGAATAVLLARHGYRVRLFDRATFPRDKACGEFLNPSACDLLYQEFGLEPHDLVALGGSPVSAVCLTADDGEVFRAPLMNAKGQPVSGFSLRRLRIDEFLIARARRAGVSVHERHNVRRLIIEDDEVTGVEGQNAYGEPFRCQAKIVLACDGTHSTAARQLELVRPVGRLQRIGVAAHFKGVTHAPGQACVSMFAARQTGGADRGVAGFSPQGTDGAVLSCVLPKESSHLISGRLREFVEEQIELLPGLAERLEGASLDGSPLSIPCFGHRLARVNYPGLLFVGDSARFVDPFTGEGIHHALEGAVYAAKVAREALRTRDVSRRVLGEYARMRRGLDARYLLCDAVQAIVNRPRLITHLVRNMRRHPMDGERLISITSDLLPARAVLSPRFLLNTFGS